MIGDIAQLLLAVAAVGTVILIPVMAYWPPEILKNLKRFKFKDFEGEVEPARVTQVAVVAIPSQASTDDPPPTLDAPPAALLPSAPADAPATDAWDLLTAGKYDEGMAEARKQLSKVEDRDEALRLEAMYVWWGFHSGTSKGFDDLENLAKRHNQSFDVQLFYSSALVLHCHFVRIGPKMARNLN